LQNANYPELRQLREKYAKDGFELVAFPSNQFGCQAPGTSEMERAYAYTKFGFEFPVMDKIAVKDKPGKCKGVDPKSYEEFKDDPDASLTATLVDDVTSSAQIAPVYQFLKQSPFDGEIPWNYTKFLVGRDGRVLKRYSPGSPFEQGMEDDVKRALAGEPLRERKGGFF
jgi:glutathione peroxidase